MTKADTKKRLGRVYIDFGYIVDLDNKEMVDDARTCLIEDLMNAFKYNELEQYIDVEEAPDASEDAIPEFLLNPDEMLDRDE